MEKGNIIRTCLRAITLALFILLLNFWFHPAWSLRSPGMWGMFFVAFAIFAIEKWVEYFSFYDDETYSFVEGLIITGVTILLAILLIVGKISSAKTFHASQYQQMITVEEGNFEQEIPEANQITVVDLDTARMVGSRTIGTLQNSTWFEIDNEYNLITYQGKEYRISPLNYGGLFKWNKAKINGIPGYVLVDARTQEAQFVKLDKAIYYSPSAHFGTLLSRHLRNQYKGLIMGGSFFEIDDEGNPYWITAVKSPTIGMFGGMIEEQFIITDANSGKSEIFDVENLPEWVDHAYGLNYLMELTTDSYKYVHGWWNSVASKTDVKALSFNYKGSGFAGYNSIVTKEGIQFFTGVTPANKAESNLGFILVSTRTGKVKYYECPGAEESSAQAAAEGLVQNLAYKATYPTIVNVDGIETYYMTLKDGAGLIQRYSFCNVRNYTQVVEAPTFEEAMKLYKTKLGVETDSEIEEVESTSKIQGIVAEIQKAEVNGYTYYYFKLEDSENIYISSIENSNKQPFMKAGEEVQITFVDSKEDGVYIVREISF